MTTGPITPRFNWSRPHRRFFWEVSLEGKGQAEGATWCGYARTGSQAYVMARHDFKAAWRGCAWPTGSGKPLPDQVGLKATMRQLEVRTGTFPTLTPGAILTRAATKARKVKRDGFGQRALDAAVAAVRACAAHAILPADGHLLIYAGALTSDENIIVGVGLKGAHPRVSAVALPDALRRTLAACTGAHWAAGDGSELTPDQEAIGREASATLRASLPVRLAREEGANLATATAFLREIGLDAEAGALEALLRAPQAD